MRDWAIKAFGRGIGVVAAGALFGVGVTSCKSSCDDKGTCAEYGGPVPQCDGYFHYPDGGICDASTCAVRGDDGLWRYPDGTVRREPGDPGPCPDGGADGGGAEGGTDGATDGSTLCPASARPDTDACAISDDLGVFVSPSGVDRAGSGTQAAPFKTIAAGLAQAKATHKRLYVCAATTPYAEVLTLDTSVDGVDLYGGFDCSTPSWSYGSLKAKIQPAKPIASRIEDLALGSLIQDFEITAADATQTDPNGAGQSSLGMIVTGSQNVLLRRVTITAGKGADGAPGANGSSGAAGEQPGDAQRGANTSCAAGLPSIQDGGSWAGPNSCGSIGGSGGLAFLDGAKAGDSGAYGMPQTNVTPIDQQNGGLGATAAGAAGIAGSQGSPGNSGSNGAEALGSGSFSPTGYAPADGSDGTNGFPGQGGGGGGASKGNGTCIGASGAAGGMGGCGGIKGTAGKGGGASVALLSLGSGVTLEACELIASSGGKGGKGGDAGDGGAGGPGAAGGTGLGSIVAGGDGGRGGSGGPAGSGSGGSGGPSFALVYDQANPPTKTTDSTLTPGLGGTKGTGGTLPGTTAAPDGSDGSSDAEHPVGV